MIRTVRFDEKKARKTRVLFWGNTPCGLIPKKHEVFCRFFPSKNHLEFETEPINSKSLAGCLHIGQIKSCGKTSPS